MDEVNVICLAVGRCVDACCLLLDLLIRASSWLLHFLSGVGASLHNTLLVLQGSTLLEYWNFALFSFLSASEAVSGAACGALHAVEGWLQALGGVFESFKMVGHLSCHVAWRIRDVLQRGFISGSCILRQTCEGLCIALSLVLYFVNTVVNVVLISTHRCVSVLAGAWEVVGEPVHRVVDLALTALTFLYSCLAGASVLLWTPCQMLLDFLDVVFTAVDPHGCLLVAAAFVSLTLLLLNPRLPVLVRRLSLHLFSALPGARGAHVANEEVPTRRPQEVSTTRLPRTDAVTAETELLSVSEPSQPDSQQPQQDGAALRRGRTASTPTDGGASLSDGELLLRLKEQEERKKCVICQDLSKTVLLLPCRHLCLCRHCADILTRRRHAQQRCCPLCRQDITQTMDVFL